MENAQVLVILDTSGSMSEMGKLLLARNLVSYLRQCVSVELYTWNEQLQSIALASDEELPLLEATGQNNLNSLRDFLKSRLANGTLQPVLLFSDGNVSNGALASFAIWRKEQANLVLEAVAIGPDANHAVLEELAAPGRLFVPENVAAALTAVLTGPGEVPPPIMTADINVNAAPVEDEW